MKKLFIAALIGAIIMFAWQTLSWTILNLHHANQEYTSAQDSILRYLGGKFHEDGSYLLPNSPPGTSAEAMQNQMEAAKGKPWVEIQYHQTLDTNMGKNIGIGFFVDLIILILFTWILMAFGQSRFGPIFIASLATGVIVFLNSPFTIDIWYPKRDIMAHFLDAVVSWGLCGLWLGWYIPAKKVQQDV